MGRIIKSLYFALYLKQQYVGLTIYNPQNRQRKDLNRQTTDCFLHILICLDILIDRFLREETIPSSWHVNRNVNSEFIKSMTWSRTYSQLQQNLYSWESPVLTGTGRNICFQDFDFDVKRKLNSRALQGRGYHRIYCYLYCLLFSITDQTIKGLKYCISPSVICINWKFLWSMKKLKMTTYQ